MTEPPKKNSDLATYSSAGIQMVLTILLFTYLGYRLDSYFETDKPLWTALLAIFGVVVAMIYMVKSFLKAPPKKKEPEAPDAATKAPAKTDSDKKDDSIAQ